MTFSLPDKVPYPGYEIERFESEGGMCGRNSKPEAENNERLHEKTGINRQKTRESSRGTKKTG
jgi:hypothetical protein